MGQVLFRSLPVSSVIQEYKKRQVITITATWRFSLILLHAMNQFLESTFQIREVLAQSQEGSLEAPKARNTFRKGALIDTLGYISQTLLFPSSPLSQWRHLTSLLSSIVFVKNLGTRSQE